MSGWRSLFPGAEEGVEGSLPFRFENFGTFAGPQDSSTNYDYDKASQENVWHTAVPGDGYAFKNSDLGAYLYNNELNYVGFHCDGVSTAQMTLEHCATEQIPVFTVKADLTNLEGSLLNVICPEGITCTGPIVAKGDVTTNGSFRQNGASTLNGSVTVSGVGDLVQAFAQKLDKSSKGFDIKHPNKEGHRLRHICVEGPEDGPIYVRGKLEGNLLQLPDYWDELIDKESISVHLTPIGVHQELFVEKIEWGKNVYVKNANGGPVKCYYQVWAARQFEEKLQVEYEGETPADYPGDNSHFSIAGYDYDRRQD